MSVATSTRTRPARKASSARCRAFCALLPWITSASSPSLRRFSATRSAPRFVRAKTMARPTSGSPTSASSRARFSAVAMSSTFCSIFGTTVACGATSTRSGSRRNSFVRSSISGGIVAEKSSDCRRGCSFATSERTGLMKPMSSMRSASSSTTKRVSSSRSSPPSTRSTMRPGVAITTSTPRAMPRTWALRDMPPRTSWVESRPPAKLRRLASICTASSRVGARMSARQVFGLGRPLRPRIACTIGRPKAAVLPVPVCATPSRSRPSSCAGIEAAWIGVGRCRPERASASMSGREIPRSAKVVLVKTSSFSRGASGARRSCPLVRRT